MKFEVFENIILSMKKTSDTSQQFYHLGLDLTQIEDDYSKIITTLLSAYYSEEGYDVISWFLYERESFSNEGVFNKWIEDGKEIDMTMPILYKTVEKIRKSKNFKEYELKVPLTEEQRMDILKQLFYKNV